ncbi:MAG: beta-ketoacyl synthase N-terminal-like domain-containing protein [Akkermansia sp.]
MMSSSLPSVEHSPLICGMGLASGLGIGVMAHREAMLRGDRVSKPLGELWGYDHSWSHLYGAWIPDRRLFENRHQGPASSLSLVLARQAIAEAGWGVSELHDAALVVGSSRGNAAGWLDDWPHRRRVKLLSVPQSLHSELASCVSLELGIHGPYHVVSNGCASGLDALGFAWMLLQCGMVKRVLAIGVDLPLSPSLLDTYHGSRMLSPSGKNNPYHPEADGMIIAEGGAALALEMAGERQLPWLNVPRLLDYRSNSDAHSPLSMPPSGHYMSELLSSALTATCEVMQGEELPVTLCPHASGTRGNALSESAALTRAFQNRALPDFRLMKPWVGHAIGGSGILELALMLIFARDGMLPPNLPSLSPPVLDGQLSESVDRAGKRLLIKSASSMGGHNAVVSIGIGM